jgi:hypothetical protein
LEVFGFSRLEDLPTLREIDDLVPSEAGGDPEVDEAEGTPVGVEGSETAPVKTALHGAADATAEVGSGSGELH